MDNSHMVRQKITLFLFILSGILLRNPLLSYRHVFLTFLLTGLLGVLFAYFYYTIFLSPGKLRSPVLSFLFGLTGSAAIIVCCAVYLFDYAISVSFINEYYASDLFMMAAAVFVLFVSGFAAYSGYPAISMLCGILIWVMPLFLSPTYFAFIEAGYREPFSILLSDPFDSRVILNAWKCALLLFSDICVLLYLIRSGKGAADPGEFKKIYTAGICFAFFVFAAETLKCTFLFGDGLLALTKEPNLAATRLIPGLNIPEIYTVNLSCALVVKLSVYFSAAVSLIRTHIARRANLSAAIIPGVAALLLFSLALHALPREFTTQNEFFLSILSLLTIIFPLLSYINARRQK